MKPELSIIIPVYNVECYLRACLDSVLSQTFRDWELVLVDDGSKDGSGLICDEYAAKDSRIVVIHKENGGVSAARNAGLDIAAGKYITFIDSDDEYGLETTLEDNIAVLKADPSIDFLQFPYVHVKNDVCRFVKNKRRLLASRVEVLDFMLEDKITGYLWTKIFRSELFDGIRFPVDVTVTEDLRILISLLEKVSRVYMSDMGVYRYYKRSGSLIMSMNLNKEIECADTFFRLLSTAKNYNGVDKVALSVRFFTTLSHLLKIYALYGGENLQSDLEKFYPYIPSWKLLTGRLRIKYKLKLLQVKLLGLARFAKWNICSKRRRYKHS